MDKSWKLLTGLMIVSFLLLSGCQHDRNQAESIYTELEKAARMEEPFADKQQELKETGGEEQDIYDQILDLDTEQVDELKQHIEDGQKNNQQQKQLLHEMNADLDKAYELATSTKSAAEDIKDSEQKSLATEAVELMEKRHKLFKRYYEQYEDVLKAYDQFYDQLQQKDRDVTQLDKKIKIINKHYNEMGKSQDQFNQCTKQYNKTKNNYYQIAGLV